MTMVSDSPSRTAASADMVLDVQNLNVAMNLPTGRLEVVCDVSFDVRRGETLAIVGESGSGKSVTNLGILRLTPPPPLCEIKGKALLYTPDGAATDLVTASKEKMRTLRGGAAAMIFQEPMTSLNPVHTVGDQIAEGIRFHEGLGKRAALAKATELLDLVGIPEPTRRLSNYPHELSGGMRQRVMIAIALSCDPVLLIADEPTTALDVTIQAQILDLLQRLQERTKMAIIFITHNLGVVAEIAHKVMVMYCGRIVERGDVVPVFKAPLMPYTRGLLNSVPRLDLAGRHTAPLSAIPGKVPDLADPPPGCSFSPRCGSFTQGLCDAEIPNLEEARFAHWVRCARWRELTNGCAS